MSLFNRRNLERALIFVLCAVVVFLLTGEPRGFEFALLDLRFAVDRSVSDDEHAAIAVLLADTRTEAALGRVFGSSWRDIYPEVIETLSDAGAAAIVWDAAFAESEPELDPRLADSMRSGVPVIAGEDSGSPVTPVIGSALAGIGWLVLLGPNSVPRRIPYHEDPMPLSAVAARYLPGSSEEKEFPGSGLFIDYSRDLSDVPRFSLIDVIDATEDRLADDLRTPLSVFRDRLVFVGQDLPAYDRYELPGTAGGRIPGVFAQVAATLTVAQERPITRMPRWADWMFAAALSLLMILGATYPGRPIRRASTICLGAIAIVVPILLFAVWRVWISYGAVLVGAAMSLAAVGITRRLWLMKSYRTSLGFDPQLIQQHQHLIESYATGVERHAAVLCSDVRDYTQFVTDHSPDLVQRVMTEYMAAMEQVVDSFGGYVNKYVGDEIVAVFGFPRDEKDCVERSVKAALAMLDRLKDLQGSWHERGLPALEAIGIGLDAGSLRFTHIGGRHRVQFDVIGNAINGASRLQLLTKEHKRPLVLPAEVVEAQEQLDVVMYGTPPDQAPEKSVTFIGEVMVRGQGRRRVYGLT